MAIYKTESNNTWYVMVRYQDWTGERKQKCKRGFATKREAAQWEQQFILQKKASMDMELESFCKLYEEDVRPRLKKSTWLTKENIIKSKILPYLGKRKVSEITAKDVLDWHNELRKLTSRKGKPLSPTYLKTIHGQLSTIFNHLHIDFVPYVTGWKGKGMDIRVSLKQALKSLGFQGGNKHDTELNQWINHEKEVLADIAKQYGIEWEQKGTHEEHLDVYNFKKKERKKEVQALEQEKEYLTAENEGLTAQIAESKADIQLLKEDKEQAVRDKEAAEKRAEKAEIELKSLEERREQLQPIIDNVSKEIKEYGTVKTLLPEAGALERAGTYRDKKVKPLFIQMKNKIAAMAAQVKELTKEVEKWKNKYQKTKQAYNSVQKELDDMRKDNQKLLEEKNMLQSVSDRYDRVVRVMGIDTVEAAVLQDIHNQKALEEKRRMEQMPKGSIYERLAWGAKKSEMENQQRKKNKTKNRGMEI